VDGARLYALAADGTLLCLETATGKRIWGMNLMEKFGGRVPTWGISESPLVEGDRVIVTPGGRGASVVALEKRKGDVLWQSQSDRAAILADRLRCRRISCWWCYRRGRSG
jgi:outer membrane protein assembly factor BamB